MGFNSAFKGLIAVCCGESIDCAGNGKAIPVQAWTGPKGSRMMRLPDLNTFGT